MNPLMNDMKVKMAKTVEAFQVEISKLRTGRANVAILDGIRVECYGSAMPLNQVATVSVPESRLITISPWDKGVIGDIEKAILKSGIGLQPNNDGKLIRLGIPILTEERRKDLVKMVKKEAEEGRISLRNIRRETNEHLKKSQKDGHLTEDDLRKMEAEVQKLTDEFIAKIDQSVSHKEKEVMEV
ncbi:MAG: ribosome recycling factor [Deltaproteobacteria bacterium]|nr:ribosome recycling factor [Deltaproteobacteria bacterium]